MKERKNKNEREAVNVREMCGFSAESEGDGGYHKRFRGYSQTRPG